MAQVYAGIDYSRLRDAVKAGVSAAGLSIAIDYAKMGTFIRYGRLLDKIFWIYSDDFTAPAAGTKLVSYTPPAGSGKRVWVYGIYLDSTEANVYEIRWVSNGVVKSYRFRTGGAGTLHTELANALNEGLPADVESEVYLVLVNAGTANSVYRAGLLLGEST